MLELRERETGCSKDGFKALYKDRWKSIHPGYGQLLCRGVDAGESCDSHLSRVKPCGSSVGNGAGQCR